MSARLAILEGIQQLLDKYGSAAFCEWVDKQALDAEHDGSPPTASDSSPTLAWVVVAVWEDLEDGERWSFTMQPDKQMAVMSVGLLALAPEYPAL